MTVDRTELKWTYEPSDFFEAPYRHAGCDFDLMVDAGTAMANLTVPTNPVPSDLEERVRSFIENVFLLRKFQLHKNYKLEGPTIYQKHSSGRKDVSVRLEDSIVLMDQVDVIVTDAEGNIKRDSKAERIAESTSELDLLAPKLQQSSTLRGLFVSYSRSVADPDDEFTHLYEIRDALCHHYGGKCPTLSALGINASDWGRFGFLTNEEQLEQSRHRGKHSHGPRPATAEELDEARKLARQWIIAFARTV